MGRAVLCLFLVLAGAAMDLEGHSHMSAPPAAFREGMRWLFGPD